MRIEDVVNMLGKHINKERYKRSITKKSHFVVQKSITPTKVNIYKEFSLIVWEVCGKIKNKILTVNRVERVPAGLEDSILEHMELEVVSSILDFMKSDIYEEVIKGEYGSISK